MSNDSDVLINTFISNLPAQATQVQEVKKDMFDDFEKINVRDKFFYIFIIIIFLFLASKSYIGLNIVFGFVLGMVYVFIKFRKTTKDINAEEQSYKNKLAQIKPAPKKFGRYLEIIDFFFSIQDFYDYSPANYSKVVYCVDDFLQIYEDVKTGAIVFCRQNYDVMNDSKKRALDHLQYMLYSFESNQFLHDKLQRSIKRLNEILTTYLREIAAICNKEIQEQGYNHTTLPVQEPSPHPFNYYLPDTIMIKSAIYQ